MVLVLGTTGYQLLWFAWMPWVHEWPLPKTTIPNASQRVSPRPSSPRAPECVPIGRRHRVPPHKASRCRDGATGAAKGAHIRFEGAWGGFAGLTFS